MLEACLAPHQALMLLLQGQAHRALPCCKSPEPLGGLRVMAKSSSAKRIQKELAEISLDPPCNCSAGPKGDNIYEWVSTIVGPSGDAQLSAAFIHQGLSATDWWIHGSGSLQ